MRGAALAPGTPTLSEHHKGQASGRRHARTGGPQGTFPVSAPSTALWLLPPPFIHGDCLRHRLLMEAAPSSCEDHAAWLEELRAQWRALAQQHEMDGAPSPVGGDGLQPGRPAAAELPFSRARWPACGAQPSPSLADDLRCPFDALTIERAESQFVDLDDFEPSAFVHRSAFWPQFEDAVDEVDVDEGPVYRSIADIFAGSEPSSMADSPPHNFMAIEAEWLQSHPPLVCRQRGQSRL